MDILKYSIKYRINLYLIQGNIYHNNNANLFYFFSYKTIIYDLLTNLYIFW